MPGTQLSLDGTPVLPEALVARLRTARRIGVMTGAGFSAESGLQTFRSAGGLWNNTPVEEVATPEGFRRDPERCWRFYEQRRGEMLKAQPNPGHVALARWDSWLRARGGWLEVLTQNIDGLHQSAGSEAVTELHGSAWIMRCVICGRERVDFSHPLQPFPPRCACAGLMRPGVVWFGEGLPEVAVFQAQDIAERAEVFISAGTSARVYPAAGFIEAARHRGAVTVEVNPEETPQSGWVDWALRYPSGVALPILAEAAMQESP